MKVEVLRLRDTLLQSEIPALQFFSLWRESDQTRFFAKTSEGLFLAASPNVLELNGMDREEDIIGLSDHDLYPPAMAQKFVEADRQILVSERPVTGIREAIRDKEGILDWYVTDKLPIRSRDRKVVGIMGTSRKVGRSFPDGKPEAGIPAALRHLQDHFREELSMDRLAGVASLSLRQFNRNFRRQLGMPPHQYLIRMRVLAARDMLLSNSSSVSEIAYALGFGDETLFIRHFKRRMGRTPLQYRIEHQ